MIFRSTIIISIIVLFIGNCTQINSVQSSEKQVDETKILFIGSSYFNYHNLPGLIDNMAEFDNNNVFIENMIINGQFLDFHANSQATENKINEVEWDYIILQGVGRQMAYPEIFTDHPAYPALLTLKNKIFSNSESTSMIFCLPWAFEDGMSWLEGWTDKFSDMQKKITENTLEYAEDIGFTIAPVGVAWQAVLEDQNYPLHYLHEEDWNHPSLRGSYLTACVIYATIFLNSVNDIPFYANLTIDEARYFQAVASSIVFDDYDLWFSLMNVNN
ncbi:DUF4886 domain-containing protein [Candidatus Neomarinimicrobiota bacterium]